jgi:aspartyl-tRNA(Asn)/glutamyl-tRNA(Gln) amidotransferase subunit B
LAMPSEVSAARNGNKNVLNKIIGVVIKQSRGRLDARRVREVIEQMVFGESRPPS